MKQNIEIEVPEGFEAKYNPETKTIEMVEKDGRIKSWGEFCRKNPIKRENSWWFTPDCEVNHAASRDRDENKDRNICSTKEEAEAIITLMQLKLLYHNWTKDIQGRYGNYYINIIRDGNEHYWGINWSQYSAALFSFPEEETAREFLNTFSDLFEKIKPLFI